MFVVELVKFNSTAVDSSVFSNMFLRLQFLFYILRVSPYLAQGICSDYFWPAPPSICSHCIIQVTATVGVAVGTLNA